MSGAGDVWSRWGVLKTITAALLLFWIAGAAAVIETILVFISLLLLKITSLSTELTLFTTIIFILKKLNTSLVQSQNIHGVCYFTLNWCVLSGMRMILVRSYAINGSWGEVTVVGGSSIERSANVFKGRGCSHAQRSLQPIRIISYKDGGSNDNNNIILL